MLGFEKVEALKSENIFLSNDFPVEIDEFEMHVSAIKSLKNKIKACQTAYTGKWTAFCLVILVQRIC